MISLPKTTRNRATFRIMYMPEGHWTDEAQPWQILPVPAVFVRGAGTLMPSTVAQGGYHVGSISRWCLPDEDRAEFYIDTGTINGVEVHPTLDFIDTAIRIQVLDDETFPNGAEDLPTDGWKTVFSGTVIYESRSHQPGLDSFGRITYYCAGTLWRTRNWPLARHSVCNADQSAVEANHAAGHPGYNVPLHGYFRKVLGNRSILEADDPYGDAADYMVDYKCHRMPLGGSSDTEKWTDAQVVKHALISSRSPGEPIITADLSRGVFDGTFSWSVTPGDSCWDLLRRVCNRQRGRGAVFLDYYDDPNGNLYHHLVAYSPFNRNVSYRTPTENGSLTMDRVVTIDQGETGVSAIDVDINGDHRVTEEGVKFELRQSSVFDCIVVQGEKIQVLCNLNFFGNSLSEAWTPADEATFAAIPVGQVKIATSNRWKHVFRRFRYTGAMTVKTDPDATSASINYFCSDDGDIRQAQIGNGLNSTMSVRILPDLPIYEGYRYDNMYPKRWDEGEDYMPPSRMPPVVMYKTDATVPFSADWLWFPLTNSGWNIQTDDFGMYLYNPLEDQNGCRLLSTKARAPNWFKPFEMFANFNGVSTLSGLDFGKLNTIVGLELGTRVSVTKSYDAKTEDAYSEKGRRMVMTVSGLHLWLLAPRAIWEFDATKAGQLGYCPGLRAYNWANALPTISRDDRAELSFIAALAFEYYGNPHNPGTWGLYDCGLMTSFQTETTGAIEYPKLGQLVGKLKYAGEQGAEYTVQLDTPITSIHYDHERGSTTWRTDYVSYDGNVQ
jgi:hypothetical protein